MYIELILCVPRINFVCTSNHFCVYRELCLCVPRIMFVCTSNYFCVYIELILCTSNFFLCVPRIIFVYLWFIFVCTSNYFCVFAHKSVRLPCAYSNCVMAVCCHGRFLGNLRSVINLLISEQEFETWVLLETRHRLLDASGTANSVIRELK